ncbi:gamma-carboxygeranoyl-CoA hydratase [Oceanisphaera marina]|uniref:Gamma-carboxygeranoyl-CoA hydratase n=1 Tax=Oceanisphaera marina TaxID=2017550 RepID=A0ABQ1J057_9GAMM|nr:enoyl-CoA hydratase-related protein [Oceanisphaera marina]GGB53975.1 gamma-carboxygeranoyl-CoA hydratase [Oceanisphaera marina]
MSDPVLLEARPNGVVELILNRPEQGNALNESMIDAMADALRQAENIPSLRLLIIKSLGKHFSAGADLNWMQQARQLTQEQNVADARKLARLLQQIDVFAHPVLALVQGAAYGGALGIISCCDLVVASANSRFCFSEVRLGLIPATISPYVLRAMGQRQARRYLLTAEVITAPAAERLGLIHCTAAPAQSLNDAAAELIGSLLRNGPAAMSAAKHWLQQLAEQPITAELIERSAQRLAEVRVSDEAQQGLSAFLQQRPAAWEDDNA